MFRKIIAFDKGERLHSAVWLREFWSAGSSTRIWPPRRIPQGQMISLPLTMCFNLVPRVSHLTAPGDAKMWDPVNEVVCALSLTGVHFASGVVLLWTRLRVLCLWRESILLRVLSCCVYCYQLKLLAFGILRKPVVKGVHFASGVVLLWANEAACALSLTGVHFASGVVLLCVLLSAKVTGIWNLAKACCLAVWTFIR